MSITATWHTGVYAFHTTGMINQFSSHSVGLLVRVNWNPHPRARGQAVLKIDSSYFGYKVHPVATTINNLRLKIEAKISLWVRRHFPYLLGVWSIVELGLQLSHLVKRKREIADGVSIRQKLLKTTRELCIPHLCRSLASATRVRLCRPSSAW